MSARDIESQDRWRFAAFGATLMLVVSATALCLLEYAAQLRGQPDLKQEGSLLAQARWYAEDLLGVPFEPPKIPLRRGIPEVPLERKLPVEATPPEVIRALGGEDEARLLLGLQSATLTWPEGDRRVERLILPGRIKEARGRLMALVRVRLSYARWAPNTVDLIGFSWDKGGTWKFLAAVEVKPEWVRALFPELPERW
jgi:hypothetical protein